MVGAGRELIHGQQTFSLIATGDAPEVISANWSHGYSVRLRALEHQGEGNSILFLYNKSPILLSETVCPPGVLGFYLSLFQLNSALPAVHFHHNGFLKRQSATPGSQFLPRLSSPTITSQPPPTPNPCLPIPVFPVTHPCPRDPLSIVTLRETIPGLDLKWSIVKF